MGGSLCLAPGRLSRVCVDAEAFVRRRGLTHRNTGNTGNTLTPTKMVPRPAKQPPSPTNGRQRRDHLSLNIMDGGRSPDYQRSSPGELVPVGIRQSSTTIQLNKL